MKRLTEMFSVPKSNKLFIIILTVIAIISGSLFYFKLNVDDQNLIKTYVENLTINNEYNSFLGILGFNFLIVLIIWILGLSMIGVILNLFIYFVKIFVTSLEITAIINIFTKKGILIAFTHVFPHQILNILVLAVLVIYSTNLSLTFILSLLKKETISFSKIMHKYNKLFICTIISIILTSLYECYLAPIITKLIVN